MNTKIGRNWIYKRARFSAFTVIELMIVMMVTAVVGGVAVSAFFITINSYNQADDHVNAAREVEFAMITLRPQFTNIGLGMPNNTGGTGSFNISFTGPTGSQPVMAYMGDITWSNKSWGGPVTLGRIGAHNDITNQSLLVSTPITGTRIFAGEELFYVWAVPTKVRLQRGSEWSNNVNVFSSEGTNPPIEFKFIESGDVRKLVDFEYDYGRRIGVSETNRGANVRSWIVFPSFRIPLLIEESGGIDQFNDTLTVRVSPYSYDPLAADYAFQGSLHGYEEVHLVQAASIFANEGNLIQRIYENASSTGYFDRVLATNVFGVYFVYDDERRILTMYTVACGNSYAGVSSAYNTAYLKSNLPDHVPDEFINNADRGYRILVERMTWRIRN